MVAEKGHLPSYTATINLTQSFVGCARLQLKAQ